ncbi:peptide/nickel transport system substrate-binding protein [Caldanaerobius fijiensis DSM 17918]|uniref:Peptide/nickel transport system substrate-binding protein n=1 Tax=Caldanaerobius fijiensis DSM 17918 TaxID=1121256 RepID=A0A1M4SRV1_9THEO|nr:ABC transporter substrate-binding protein [Caldanaerobius fijiensis]SHE34929.1 peptide/nickel transport system substrate-binding protein [Caldanaerobius fijiensis DSM 17918]
MLFKRSRFMSIVLILIVVLSFTFSGCGSKTKSTSINNNSTKTSQVSDDENSPKVNKQKIFREGQCGWPKPPLYQGNPFASGGIGWPASAAIMEGLYQFVRTSDKIYPRLAESMPIHEGNKSIVKIRKGVTWNDGKPFTSKDIWAYYTLNNGEFITKMLKAIETPDDYTVVFVWNDPQPIDKIKNLLIAQPSQGTIPYHIYGKYVDKAAELLKKGKPATSLDKRGPFGIDLVDDKQLNDELTKNWQAFIKENPKLPIGTGPYKVEKVTASDMILVKRPDYWNAKNVKFDKIICKQVPDLSGQYAMLRGGLFDRYDGTQPKDILESILAANKDLIHYKMPNYSDRGFVYNIQKPPFNDVRFRRALTYVFDKSKIREVGNYYGIESTGYSIMGMPLQFVEWFVPQDIKDKMTKFRYDPAEAEKELKAIGWSKGSDGIWRDKNGKMHEFVIGANNGNFSIVTSAEVSAEQLTKFGFPTKVKSADSSIFYAAAQDKHEYDMSADTLDVSWAFNVPWWPLSNFYWGYESKAGNFPRIQSGPQAGKLNMVYPGPDGKMVDIDKMLKQMLYMSEEDMNRAAGVLTWIANENAFGLDWFQNTTGTWFNMKTVKMKGGWPMADQIQKYNRDMPIPTDQKDLDRIIETNIGFGGFELFVNGELMPN